MTRRRFFVPRDAIQKRTAHLSEAQSHHLRNVLRIGPGESVEVFDGEGNGYAGIVEVRDSSVSVHHLEPLPPQSSKVPLVLAATLIKPSKFEWILQKATELGVCTIIPIMSRRCNIQIPQPKLAQRCERWNRIVREASRQCGSFFSPYVQPPIDYSEMLSRQEFNGFAKFLFYEKAKELWQPGMLGGRSGGILLCVGPEGGWEESEIEQAIRAGFRISGLGPWTLRAETAAVSAMSIVQYHINLQSCCDSTD